MSGGGQRRKVYFGTFGQQVRSYRRHINLVWTATQPLALHGAQSQIDLSPDDSASMHGRGGVARYGGGGETGHLRRSRHHICSISPL